MSRRAQYPRGLHDINVALKDAGHPQFRLHREGGRFHFNGPKTDKWPEASVNVKRLEQLSVKEWMDAFKELKEMGDQAVELWNNPAYQPGHSVDLGYTLRNQPEDPEDEEKPMKENRFPNAQRRINEKLNEAETDLYPGGGVIAAIMNGASKIDTGYGKKTAQGVSELIRTNYVDTAVDALLQGSKHIQTDWGKKSREGLTAMIRNAPKFKPGVNESKLSEARNPSFVVEFYLKQEVPADIARNFTSDFGEYGHTRDLGSSYNGDALDSYVEFDGKTLYWNGDHSIRDDLAPTDADEQLDYLYTIFMENAENLGATYRKWIANNIRDAKLVSYR